jgi:hypothetical protein
MLSHASADQTDWESQLRLTVAAGREQRHFERKKAARVRLQAAVVAAAGCNTATSTGLNTADNQA